jgi:antitoxin component YwqK of YwqJK toxin-antitoxin module
MKRVAMMMALVGCSQGNAKEPVAPVPVAPQSESEKGMGPETPEFWRAGVKVCESVGKLYEYDGAYGCEIQGEVTLSMRFDGQGRLTEIARFGKPVPPETSSKLEGALTEYYPGAGRRTEQGYHLGKAEGPVTHYHPSGAKSLEGQYVDDKADGEFRGWDGAGKLMGTYVMRAGTGEMTEWHDNGAVASVQNFVGGKEHGEHREWFADGKPKREVRFEAGEEVGADKQWRALGVKELEGTWEQGRHTGVWRFYDAAGALERIDTFEDDSRVSTAPHVGGKPVGALGSPGKCATEKGFEAELFKQRRLEARHACTKRPERFPAVIIVGELEMDRGCAHPVIYADCNFRKPLDATQLLTRAGIKNASPALRSELFLSYVETVALAWTRTTDLSPTTAPDGTLTIETSTYSPIGMRSDEPSTTSPITFTLSPSGRLTTK